MPKYKNFNNLIKSETEYDHPEHLKDLIKLIKKYSSIRFFSSKHAFNDISLSHQNMINMDKFDKILEYDKYNNTVKVESGIKISKLLRELKKYNLTIPILPAISSASIAGTISTNTHGSCNIPASISDIVTKIVLIKENGQAIEIDKNSKYFPAAICSLGTIGCIYSVSLNVTDLFYIKETVKKMESEIFYKNVNMILEKYEYTQCFLNWQKPKFMEVSFRKVTNKKTNNTYFNSDLLTFPDKSHYIETELAVDLKYIETFILDIIKFHKNNSIKYDIYPNSHLLLRFSAPGNSLIGMNSNHKTLYVSTFFDVPKDKEQVTLIYEYLELLSDAFIIKYKARPHYSKIHNLDYHKMRILYGDNFLKFLKIKQELDPNNKFNNEFINKLLIKNT